MAAKKVEIISSEMMKPYSPTPESHRIYKLSLKDQMGAWAPDNSCILFYATTPSNNYSTHLKESLRLVLNHDCRYPLAGRIDRYSIECKDQGVLFLQARVVNEELSNVMKNPKNDVYSKLFPQVPHGLWKNPCDRELLAVQVSEFVNGGITVAVSGSHAIMDGAALAFFLKNWAEITLSLTISQEGKIKFNKNIIDLGGFVVEDCNDMFPPIKHDYVLKGPPSNEAMTGNNTKGNVFTFDASNIACIKEKCLSSSRSSSNATTRFEAVSAFLWASIIAARKKCGQSFPMHLNGMAVNIRGRLVPPLPEHCLGNWNNLVAAVYDDEEEDVDDLVGILVEKIRDSIKKVNHEELVKEKMTEEEFKCFLQNAQTASIAVERAGQVVTSSFCRFPFYEIDFGWGKPSWVGLDMVANNFVKMLDTPGGDGIEAWVRLPEDEMAKLEQDINFLSCVSSVQSL